MELDIARLYNLWRDIGSLLNDSCPGLTEPLPENDPDIIEAIKVVSAADDMRAAR